MEIQIGELEIHKPLLLWINDGLMAIFFLLVGLEIKREALEGELSTLAQIALPGIAAAGGMAVPALVYVLFNLGSPAELKGWAIPAATDIAFALGILALLRSRVPLTLKVFLLAIAIIDDLGAIVIIALFYTKDLSLMSLLLASIGLVTLTLLNRLRVVRLAPYVLAGIFIWVCVLKSGVHATLAGVALAFAIPIRARDDPEHSPLRELEHILHPWVAYGIMPIFAFANAGVPLVGITVATLLSPLPLGIAMGLFVGKQISIFGSVWLAVKLRLCALPQGATWPQIYGVALLCGVGFTMSLFIGTLAFEDPQRAVGVRIGVLGGSILSAIIGYLVLRMATSERSRTGDVGQKASTRLQ